LKLSYTNREDVDFDAVESYMATQEWDLVQTGEVVEYNTRISKMTNVRNVSLYFPMNFGNDTTRLTYIGLKGEWTEIRNDPVVVLYEATANPADHKNPNEERVHHSVN